MSKRPTPPVVDSDTGLPADFVRRLRQIVPERRIDEVLRSFQSPRRVAFRVNTLLGGPEAVFLELNDLRIEVQSVDWSDTAATIPATQKPALTASPVVMEGRVYVQGLSSQLAPLVLAPQAGESILDLAAAPGGKTLQIAAMMEGRGHIAAVEPVSRRWFTLRENVERAGASEMVKLFQADGRHVGRKTPERFDAALLDAPCTSEARFMARNDTTYQYWGPRKIAESARKQKALLRSAIDAMRIGGRIVYATCSFAPEENEAVLHHTLRRLGDAVTVEPVDLPVNCQPGLVEWNGKPFHPTVERSARILPNEEMTGFFVALLHKHASTSTG